MRTVTVGAILLSAVWFPTALHAEDTSETGCDVLATGADGKIHAILDGTQVLEPTRTAATFSVVMPAGYSEPSIRCERTDLVPVENDWKVLVGGYPLFIAVKRPDEPYRLGVLELQKGQVRFQTLDGPAPTSEQLARLQKRLDQLQIAMDTAAGLRVPQK